MRNDKSMLERIKTFIDYKGISVRKFEIALGMSNGTIHNAISKGSSLSSQWLTKMMEIFPELNPNWLVTGKGQMLVEQSRTPKNKTPYFNVDFSGGFVELYNDQTQNPTEYIQYKGLKEAQFWCNIKGHSMEPTICDGERIALKEMQPSDPIHYGSIYAVVTADGLRTIKRIEKGSNTNSLLLVADNKEYRSQEINKEGITHLFKVVAHLGLL